MIFISIANYFNWNFHSLEVVSCWRDLQLQELKLSKFDKIEVNSFEILLIDFTFYLNLV